MVMYTPIKFYKTKNLSFILFKTNQMIISMKYVHFSYGQCCLKLKASIDDFRNTMEFFTESNRSSNIITKLNSIKELKDTVVLNDDDYNAAIFERVLELLIDSEIESVTLKEYKNNTHLLDEAENTICIISDNDPDHPLF